MLASHCLCQALPNFGLSTSLDNISVCLIDYGEGTDIFFLSTPDRTLLSRFEQRLPSTKSHTAIIINLRLSAPLKSFSVTHGPHPSTYGPLVVFCLRLLPTSIFLANPPTQLISTYRTWWSTLAHSLRSSWNPVAGVLTTSMKMETSESKTFLQPASTIS